MRYSDTVELDTLAGLTIESVEGLKQYSDMVKINTSCGKQFIFMHFQDCCEQVQLEDFEVGTDDLSGAVILSAEESTNNDDKFGVEIYDSFTWTFYKIETTKGELWMRWLGESNGYYGEEVDLVLNKS